MPSARPGFHPRAAQMRAGRPVATVPARAVSLARTAGPLLVAVALLATLPVESSLAQGRAAGVAVDPVARVAVKETQPLIARLVSTAESLVATRVPGIIDTVHVVVGERVARDAPLATLDTELLTIERDGAAASLLQAEAGLEVATADRDLADQIFQRTQGLRGSAAFSQGRLDDLAKELARATAEVARAQAALATARSQSATAEYRLNNAVIAAPYAGVVLERHADPGDYLQLGEPVARIVDDTDLEIEADVPAEIVEALDPGDTVTVLAGAREPLTARVRAVIPNESPTTRTRPVRFAVDSSGFGDAPAPGQSVTVLAPVGEPREALSVKKDALVQRGRGWIVYVAADGKAEPRDITIGAAIDDRIEVEGLVDVGDLVVVRGNERLRPGQDIAYEAPDTPEGAAETAAEVAARNAPDAGASTN